MKQRPYKDEVLKEETTENEFSEMSDGQKGNVLKFRGQKKDQNNQVEDTKKLPLMERNVPMMIKYNNFFIRALWTIVMLVAFVFIMTLGHFYIACFILLMNVGIFNEILSLKRDYEKEVKIPLFYLINWYFFFISVFFFYGKLFSAKLTRVVLMPGNNIIFFFVTYHNIISFMLWILGFLIFVLSLKKGFYRYQFRQFGWTHITLVLVVAQCSVIIMNAYEGLAWFLLPSLLVITNDIMAYIFGICFGKTKLIELSPKKTWEGFIGGSVSTLVAAFVLSNFIQNSSALTCPMYDIGLVPFERAICEIPSVFLVTQHHTIFGTVPFSQFQIHAMVLSLFASLIAPFGGFFASGFKRAIKIKDFAAIIPGHGGITDRMDCQLLTGMFAYLYLHQIILTPDYTLHNITSYILSQSPDEQVLIFQELKRILVQRHLIE